MPEEDNKFVFNASADIACTAMSAGMRSGTRCCRRIISPCFRCSEGDTVVVGQCRCRAHCR